MVSFPPAKINLGLHIINKRADGYHNLSTCFYPLPWMDLLEIIPSQILSFKSTGLFIPGDDQDNLCLKAYHILQRHYDIPAVAIHLHKIIPMGAGLGGGSSNAAHTLRLLNTIFDLQLSTEKLMEYASQLGSDCAFFIQDKPMLGKGKGDILSPLSFSLAGTYMVVVKPPVHVSTAAAYAGVTPNISDKSIEDILLNQPIENWKNLLTNDFEASVFKHHLVIEQVKNKLYAMGAQYASMSGSGSSVFGIFNTEVADTNKFNDMIVWRDWMADLK